MSPYYFTYLLFSLWFRREQWQDLLQRVKLFISEWDERCDWLQTTAEHDIVWNSWAGDHDELSCAHLNGEWQFHAKSLLLRAKRGLPLPGSRTIICTRLGDSLHQTVYASKFPAFVGQFTRQHLCTILLWQMEIFNQNRKFLRNFHDFVLIFTDRGPI